MAPSEREKVSFRSGDADCVAWHYPGTNGACIVMAGGVGVTKEPATDLFASRFQWQGFSVLAFDFRRFGQSGGQPRQVARIGEQLDDWRAAIAFAHTFSSKVAIWGFSLAGGYVFELAADPAVAAAIAQNPVADGRAVTKASFRHNTAGALLRFTARGLADTVGGWFGRPPRLVPLAGPRGTVACLTSPDALDGDRALNPGNRYPEWEQTVAARSALRVGSYRPGRAAKRVSCPLLVVVSDRDQAALAEPALRAAARAPHADVVRVPGGHYAAFLEQHERVADAEIAFLQRSLTIAETEVDERPRRPKGGRVIGQVADGVGHRQ